MVHLSLSVKYVVSQMGWQACYNSCYLAKVFGNMFCIDVVHHNNDRSECQGT